jgi:hypothetical protein
MILVHPGLYHGDAVPDPPVWLNGAVSTRIDDDGGKRGSLFV